MDHNKKSIVLLGNGESLKKALITNILGRDLSTLKKTTILGDTQVYEEGMYEFICTPDLDKDWEDIREVFKIQHPDMNLLVVEDRFNVSDVQRQIKNLHKTTGKREEDFMVVLPLTCKNTDQQFTCCSVDQLIRKLQKPATDEHQLTPTKRPADDWMDMTVKKSIVLLGNGKSLKKALITNILGRDLSTLKKTTILSRTQVYEDDVYKFTCMPHLDNHCEDVREVFKIQRPYKSLLVVEDGFSPEHVQGQIKNLHKTTGIPEEDFMVVLPLMCKNTDQPFICCSMEQLIRELQKPAADEHHLTTTRRPADDPMDTTEKRSVAVVNLVLLGMAGTGKSATGNTILGEQRFHSTSSSISITRDVYMESTDISNTHVRLIDTPDLFDDDMKPSDKKRLVDRCKQLCGSGPLVYLLVMQVSRFTDGERDILEKMEKMFGREAKEKTVILFTRGEDLENSNMSLQDFVYHCQPKLREIIQKCGNRYVLFENKSKNQSSQQVNELMEKVSSLLDSPPQPVPQGSWKSLWR